MKSIPEQLSNPSGNSGNGKSRAAKKRAKKKQRILEAADVGGASQVSTYDGDGNLQENNGFDKKRIKSIIKDLTNDLGDELHNEEKDIEEEKDAFTRLTAVELSNMELPTLPPNTRLTGIVLLDTESIKDKELQTQLKEMTTKQRASCLLQAIIAPIPLHEFYNEYWEKKPLLVRATDKNKSRFSGLLSLESIKDMTKKHSLCYGRDLNVTMYQKGKDGIKRRITLDKLPEADEPIRPEKQPASITVENSELWSNYESGCTIRLLCPHRHNDAVHALLSTLETEFQCMVGANAYLTPPRSSQGFAPHCDDIEAFCLQLEGSKRWKVYEPTFKLPRTSSEDLTADDVENMKLVLDVTLETGDLLYMPRGWIHQACTLKDNNQHSLHLTVSAMQRWAWVDLMEMVMPEAVEAVAMDESSTMLRQGLPKGFMECMGVMHEETKDEKLPDSLKRIAEEENAEDNRKRQRLLFRDTFGALAKKRILKIAETAMEMIDATCDQMAKRHISERQPPSLTAFECSLTSHGDKTADSKQILPNTMCRLVRPGIGRLVVEDGKAVVYHCADNSRVYMGNPVSPLEFEMDDGPALEQLLTTTEPDWILVNDLYHDTIEDKIAITQALYDEGIIAIKQAEELMNEGEEN